MFGFGREKRKLKAEFAAKQAAAEELYQRDLRLATEAPRLHGFNLNKWEYLGYTEISISYTDTTYKEAVTAFFFMDKEDHSRRKYVLKGEGADKKKFKEHLWIERIADLWVAGEKEWYHPITNNPSKYTRARILREYASVWDSSKNWWVSNNASKYASATTNQNEQEQEESIDDKIVDVQDNVLTVDFGKSSEEKNV